MTRTEPHYWFPAKRHGWGWGMPRAWQGRVVLVSFCLVMVAAPLTMERPWWWAVAVAATALTLLICLKKGEPPGWRWGDR